MRILLPLFALTANLVAQELPPRTVADRSASPRITPPGVVNCAAWTGIPAWKGTFAVSGHGSGTIPDPATPNVKVTSTYESSGEITLTALVPPSCPAVAPMQWTGEITNAHGAIIVTANAPCVTTTIISGAGAPSGAVFLTADLAGKTYAVSPIVNSPPSTETQTKLGPPNCQSGSDTANGLIFPLYPVAPFPTFSLPLQPPEKLTGSQSFVAPDGYRIPVTWTISFELAPVVSCQVNPFRLTPLHQGGEIWSSERYDAHPENDPQGATIGRWGCALSSLAMALDFANGAVPGSLNYMTPGDLNAFMNGEPGDFRDGNINWGPTVASTGPGNTQFVGTRVNSKTGPGADPAKASATLDSFLCSIDPHPVIVGVKHKTSKDGKDIFPTHFVLVTGKDPISGEYTIIDPNQSSGITTLSGYDNDYTTRGIVKDPPGDLSRLDVTAPSRVTLTLIDPSERRTGVDSAGQLLQAIPQSAYFTDAIVNDVTEDEVLGPTTTVDIFQPQSPANYSIVVNGLDTGPYSIGVTIVSPGGRIEQNLTLSGNARPGASDTFTLHFNSSQVSTTSPMPGDRDGNGKVDCSDLKVVQSALGKRVGQTGYDPRADVNGDGVINILDLATVARGLPAGTVCTP